jgi:hypothetical protein
VILFLYRFVRVIIVLLVVRLLFRGLVAGLRGPATGPAARPKRDRELVRDRVCNTHLPRDRALRVSLGGREEYFCSPECRDRALAGA